MTKGNPRRQKSWCRPERLIMHDTSRHETRRLEKDQRERLLYLCDWLPPDYGAVGQYSLLFARELAAEGRDVVLAGLSSRATLLGLLAPARSRGGEELRQGAVAKRMAQHPEGT